MSEDTTKSSPAEAAPAAPRRFRPMGVIDRHLLSQFITPLAFILIALILIFNIQILMSELEDLLKMKFGAGDVLYYLYLNIPYLLGYMVPVSLLVALIYSLATLARNNEIVALRASGVSLWRLSAPLVAISLVLSLAMLWMNREIAPDFTSRSREMLIRGERSDTGDLVRNGVTYRQQSVNRTWFIRRFNVTRQTAEVVEVTEQDASGRDKRKIVAESASWDRGEWRFFRVREIQFATGGGQSSERSHGSKAYPEFFEKPRDMLVTGKRDIDGMGVARLREHIQQNAAHSSKRLAPYQTVLHYRHAMPFWCLVIALFTIPHAASTTRRNPVAGIAYPFILFAAFFFVTNFFLALGKGNRLPPVMAAWGANVIFLGVGLWTIHRKQ